MLYKALSVYKICRILQKTSVAIKLNKFKILDRIKWLVSLEQVFGSTIWLVFHCRRWTWILYHLVSSAHAREPISESPITLFVIFKCPCSWGCTRGECAPRTSNTNGEGVADVLLSLKHAVVHPGSPTGGYYSTGGSNHHYSQDYTQNLGPPVPPTHYTSTPAMWLCA